MNFVGVNLGLVMLVGVDLCGVVICDSDLIGV